MAEIYHQIGVNVEIEKVYQAITTLDGLSGWWTTTTGKTNVGDCLYFHFNDMTVEMTIKELLENKKVVWQCTAIEGEWKDTIVTFELAESDHQVLINFSHSNWAQQTSLCAHCSTKWAVFMLSLKSYLETGKGQPFPDDVKIDHFEN